MSRFYQIFDSKGTVLYKSEDMPLIIGSDSSAHIRVNDNKRIAYIAESEGHLYIQPADGSPVIFHNNELLKSSQWIKSGDVTRTKTQTISYKITSDRVEIVINKSYPAPTATVESTQSVQTYNKTELPRTKSSNKNDSITSAEKNRMYQYIIYSLLIGLLALALYVMVAKSIEIKVDPQADVLKLSGFPPPFKLGSRFLLMRGEYILHAEKSGYKTKHKTVSIIGNENILHVKFEKLPGKIKIRFRQENEQLNSASKREIFIDGKKYHGTPDQFIELVSGEHVVEIRQERYKSFKEIINIQGLGKKQIIDVELEPNWGVLNIKTLPEEADIIVESLDENKKNNHSVIKHFTSPVSMELVSGNYKLKINKIHFKSVEKDISISADEFIDLLPVILEPADAFVNINSMPENVMVFINGEYQGTAINRIRVNSNAEQQITFNAAGYMDKDIKITLKPDEERDLDISLHAEMASVFVTMNPSHARLYIDGKLQQKNNGRFRINTQHHIIEARASGYESRTFSITPDKAFSHKIDIILQPGKIKNTYVASLKEGHSKKNKRTTDYVTHAGQKMIFISADEFVMGSTKNEAGRRSNERVRKIKITHNYYLSDKEISNAQYRMFKSSHDSGNAASQSLNHEQQPVVNISWNNAAKYCNWLSLKEDLKPYYKEVNGKMTAINKSTERKYDKAYRLPFESEWSYAARINKRNKTARYSWTGSYPPVKLSGNFADESARAYLSSIIKGYNDNYIVSAPVGLFPKNPAGFFDMGGNVSEWCHDFYSASSLLTGAEQIEIDPTGSYTGSHHVVRDSSWRDASLTELRLAYRSYSLRAQDDIGFRIARYAP
jgi:formylglycine-generating enzyme required for sulfatase activity